MHPLPIGSVRNATKARGESFGRNSCWRKIRFLTEKEATTCHPDQRCYKCELCDGWHLTNIGGLDDANNTIRDLLKKLRKSELRCKELETGLQRKNKKFENLLGEIALLKNPREPKYVG